jgi:hypothetical protein
LTKHAFIVNSGFHYDQEIKSYLSGVGERNEDFGAETQGCAAATSLFYGDSLFQG